MARSALEQLLGQQGGGRTQTAAEAQGATIQAPERLGVYASPVDTFVEPQRGPAGHELLIMSLARNSGKISSALMQQSVQLAEDETAEAKADYLASGATSIPEYVNYLEEHGRPTALNRYARAGIGDARGGNAAIASGIEVRKMIQEGSLPIPPDEDGNAVDFADASPRQLEAAIMAKMKELTPQDVLDNSHASFGYNAQQAQEFSSNFATSISSQTRIVQDQADEEMQKSLQSSLLVTMGDFDQESLDDFQFAMQTYQTVYPEQWQEKLTQQISTSYQLMAQQAPHTIEEDDIEDMLDDLKTAGITLAPDEELQLRNEFETVFNKAIQDDDKQLRAQVDDAYNWGLNNLDGQVTYDVFKSEFDAAHVQEDGYQVPEDALKRAYGQYAQQSMYMDQANRSARKEALMQAEDARTAESAVKDFEIGERVTMFPRQTNESVQQAVSRLMGDGSEEFISNLPQIVTFDAETGEPSYSLDVAKIYRDPTVMTPEMRQITDKYLTLGTATGLTEPEANRLQSEIDSIADTYLAERKAALEKKEATETTETNVKEVATRMEKKIHTFSGPFDDKYFADKATSEWARAKGYGDEEEAAGLVKGIQDVIAKGPSWALTATGNIKPQYIEALEKIQAMEDYLATDPSISELQLPFSVQLQGVDHRAIRESIDANFPNETSQKNARKAARFIVLGQNHMAKTGAAAEKYKAFGGWDAIAGPEVPDAWAQLEGGYIDERAPTSWETVAEILQGDPEGYEEFRKNHMESFENNTPVPMGAILYHYGVDLLDDAFSMFTKDPRFN